MHFFNARKHRGSIHYGNNNILREAFVGFDQRHVIFVTVFIQVVPICVAY